MVGRTKSVRFHSHMAEDLVSALTQLGIQGIQLEPAEDGAQRDTEPLQRAISMLKEAPLSQSPLVAVIDSISSLIQSSNKDKDEEPIWKTISGAKISIETLVALIHVLAEEKSTPLSILASSLYFSLLQLPGAFLYHAFSALTFRTCIASLKKWIYTVAGTFLYFTPHFHIFT